MTRPDYPATSTAAGFLASISCASSPKLIVTGRPFSSPASVQEALEAMADYNFIYKDVEGTSTQWDDIQRKLGNIPPKPAPFKPPSCAPADDEDSKPKDKAWIDDKDEDELEELENDLDLDDDRFLQDYSYFEFSAYGELSFLTFILCDESGEHLGIAWKNWQADIQLPNLLKLFLQIAFQTIQIVTFLLFWCTIMAPLKQLMQAHIILVGDAHLKVLH